MNRPLRVFLCHSSNDKPAVRELYQKLRAEPWIEPWLDEEELYPGQDWNMEIEKAVEAADAIIVCLTKNSINKEGYVQRELRLVLDIALTKPEDTIFVIPLRLEECELPRRLRAWQYADYFEGKRENAHQRLLVSLKRRADSLSLGIEQSILEEKKPLAKTPLFQKEEKNVEKQKNITETAEPKLVASSQSVPQLFYDLVNNLRSSPQFETKNSPKNPGEKRPLSEQLVSSRPEKRDEAPSKIILSNGMEFMRVPAGRFLMGSTEDNKLAYEEEEPQNQIDIPYDYWMARFSISNEQYNFFVKAKGIMHPVDNWENKKDHPVRFISWDNAMSYCYWLHNLLKPEIPSGLALRLPGEAEWEKAARGDDGREYPWGNDFDVDRCNSKEYNIAETVAVETFSPQSDSPYGCVDMAGNIWEWTHSLKKNYPYNYSDGREDDKALGVRVLRGGSFLLGSRYARCASRFVNFGSAYMSFGFRICLAPPFPK